MASEFTPPGQGARMTKAQVRKYIREMKKKRELAKQKLEALENSGELEKEQEELAKLEEQLENFENSDNTPSDILAENIKILSINEFLEAKKLYKKILGFIFGKPKIKDIFLETVKENIETQLKAYFNEKNILLKTVFGSTDYKNYFLVYYEGERKEEIVWIQK